MIEFQAGRTGLVGTCSLFYGDKQKFRMRLDPMMDRGVVLTGVTTTVTSTTSTVTNITSADDQKSFFWITNASSKTETFTVTFAVTTSDGQTWNFTVGYNVCAPIVLTS